MQKRYEHPSYFLGCFFVFIITLKKNVKRYEFYHYVPENMKKQAEVELLALSAWCVHSGIDACISFITRDHTNWSLARDCFKCCSRCYCFCLHLSQHFLTNLVGSVYKTYKQTTVLF